MPLLQQSPFEPQVQNQVASRTGDPHACVVDIDLVDIDREWMRQLTDLSPVGVEDVDGVVVGDEELPVEGLDASPTSQTTPRVEIRSGKQGVWSRELVQNLSRRPFQLDDSAGDVFPDLRMPDDCGQ